jgi:hypothetical protein
MARSVNEIQQEIISLVQATPELAEASSTSKRAIWRLWTYVVAVTINLYEQLQDLFRTEVESIVALSAPQTPQWVQDRVFKFQYSATDPQVIQLIDLVPQYPNVNPALRIVTRCSVKTNLSGRVNIKAAKSEPPAPLDSLEIDALQSYINVIGVAGINYAVVSSDSDKLYIEADIYYIGSYSAVISANVIASIESYLSTLPFDGSMKLLDLEIAIRNTVGVNDVFFKNVKARKDSTPLSGASALVLNNTVISRQWPTVSGYIVGETTSGSTLADTLNFIAE